MKKSIDIASLFGCDAVVVVPGTVNDNVSSDVAYERTVKVMKELSVYAEAKNITIGIENVWNNFLLSPLEMKNIIDEIDSENVGAYFDVGNVVCNGFA